MRIIAFSDWRVQPPNKIVELNKIHKPDAFLYVGDDLNRFIFFDNLLLKTESRYLKLNYSDFMQVEGGCYKNFPKEFIELLQRIYLQWGYVLD